MALYESTFIANQELTAKQVDDLAQNFADFLKHAGGKLIRKEYWGIRNFTYAIKKQKKGHYVMFCVDASADGIAAFNKKVKAQEEILKYLSVRVKSFSEKTSSLAKLDEE